MPSKFKFAENSLTLTTLDFSGNPIFSTLSNLFFSDQSLFVITWNLTELQNARSKAQICGWITQCLDKYKESQILLVGTHLDQLHEAQKCMLPSLFSEIHSLTGLPKSNMISVSNLTGDNVNRALEMVLHSVLLLPHINQTFPSMYHKLKDELAKEKEKHILSLDEIKDLCKKVNIVGDFQVRKALGFLHQLGLILYFPFNSILKSHVVLDLPWLVGKLVEFIIYCKHNTTSKNRPIISHHHFEKIWPNEGRFIHQILLKICEQYHITIPITHQDELYEGQSLIPSLLSLPNPSLCWPSSPILINHFYSLGSQPNYFFKMIGCIILMFQTRSTKYFKDRIFFSEPNCQFLILHDPIQQGIAVLIAGPDSVVYFCKLKMMINMIFRWLRNPICDHIMCPTCCKKLSFNSILTQKDYCFEWKQLFEIFSKGETVVQCGHAHSSILLSDLLPEFSTLNLPKSVIQYGDRIGDGSFATIFSGKLNDQQIAIKELKQTLDLENFVQETLLMSTLNHPNILPILGFLPSYPSPAYIVPLAHKSLLEVLQKEKKRWTWKLCLRVILDVSSGMSYMHHLDPAVLHCDLRSPNILIFSLDATSECVARIVIFFLIFLTFFLMGFFYSQIMDFLNMIWGGF